MDGTAIFGTAVFWVNIEQDEDTAMKNTWQLTGDYDIARRIFWAEVSPKKQNKIFALKNQLSFRIFWTFTKIPLHRQQQRRLKFVEQ